MRAGEFTATSEHIPTNQQQYLASTDLTVDCHHNPQVITLHLRHSKTDQFSRGAHIYFGRTQSVLCPVSALLTYMAIRPPTPGPLFIFLDGTPLTRQKLVYHLRKAVSNLGLTTAGHSFRIGAASTAARVGINDSTIQLMGRWKSSAFLTYIRSLKDQLVRVSTLLASPSLDS